MTDDLTLGNLMTPSNFVTYMNIAKWKADLMLILEIMDKEA
jgi:hypothetical protein